MIVAAVVTRHTWTRTISRREWRSQHVGQEVETDTAHTDPACPRARGQQIVARDVALDTAAAGWPCPTCIPDVPSGSTVQMFGSTADPAPARSPEPTGRGEKPAAQPAPTAPGHPYPPGLLILDRANRYAGRCPRCGTDVAAGKGRLGKLDGGWVPVHPDCTKK